MSASSTSRIGIVRRPRVHEQAGRMATLDERRRDEALPGMDGGVSRSGDPFDALVVECSAQEGGGDVRRVRTAGADRGPRERRDQPTSRWHRRRDGGARRSSPRAIDIDASNPPSDARFLISTFTSISSPHASSAAASVGTDADSSSVGARAGRGGRAVRPVGESRTSSSTPSAPCSSARRNASTVFSGASTDAPRWAITSIGAVWRADRERHRIDPCQTGSRCG